MKKNIKRILAAALSVSMIASTAFTATAKEIPLLSIVDKIDTSDVFKTRDMTYTWEAESATTVTLSDSGIVINGSGATAEGSVLTVTDEGTYVISGSLSDGQIIVNNTSKEAKIQLVLNGVNITSSNAAPIYIAAVDKAYITLAEGTENVLTDSNSRLNSKQDAVIFAKDDTTINGTGSLLVTAAFKLAIHSENDLKICGATVTADSSNAANKGHALAGEDLVGIKDANVSVTSANDGLQTKNAEEGKGNIIIENSTVNITAVNDGLQAEHAFQLSGGELNINSTEGDGIKAVDSVYADCEPVVEITAQQGDGIKTDFVYDTTTAIQNGDIQIENGIFNITAGKDGIQAASEKTVDTVTSDEKASIQINGGEIYIESAGDGLKATDTISFYDGIISANCKGDVVLCENNSDTTLGVVNVYGGRFDIHTDKDGIQAQAQINICGGEGVINTLETALDSNGSISISGGEFICYGSDLTAENVISYSEDCTALVSGGKFIAHDNADAPVTFSETSSQGTILLTFNDVLPRGTIIEVADSDGALINSITTIKDSKNIMISDPLLTVGNVYSFKKNEEDIGGIVLETLIMSINEDELGEITVEPTAEPTAEPTVEVTNEPTAEPTAEPTVKPTAEPTQEPTVKPTAEPTAEPTVEPTQEPSGREVYDVNGDGKINSRDIASLQKHVLGTLMLDESEIIYADANGDGKLNSRDIALLQKKIMAG